MADDTNFLTEIDDALRADRVEAFWKNHRMEVLTFCVMAVLASAVSVLWKNHQHDKHEQQTTELAQANLLVSLNQYNQALPIFEKVEQEGGGVGALAAFHHALTFLKMGGHETQALEVLNDIAAGKRGDAPDDLRDYAALEADILSHNLALHSGKPPAPTQGKEAASKPGRPFAQEFAEVDALRAMQAGDTKTASTLLNGVVKDSTGPFTERVRAAGWLDQLEKNKP